MNRISNSLAVTPRCPARCTALPCAAALPSRSCCLLLLSLLPATAVAAAGRCHCFPACTCCQRCPALTGRRLPCPASPPLALPCTLPGTPKLQLLPAAATTAASHCRCCCQPPSLPARTAVVALPCLAAASTALPAAQCCPALPGRRQHCLARCPATALPCLAAASAALHTAQRYPALPGHRWHCPLRFPALPSRNGCLLLPPMLPATAAAAAGCCHSCSRPLPSACAHPAAQHQRAPRCPASYPSTHVLPSPCTSPNRCTTTTASPAPRTTYTRAPRYSRSSLAPSVQESLSPQQICEWAIWWGNPSGGASRARRRKRLSPQQCREWAVRWGATTGCTCESTPVGSAASRRGGSGGGQKQQQRPLETLSPQQLREWAVRWGSPGGGGFWGTRTGGVEAPGGVEATSPGACDSARAGAEPEEALHTFTLDSGASRCFFHDSTIVTPHTAPVPVTLADPSKGPWVNVIQPGGELVAICTDSHTGEHLATFTRRPGSGPYTLITESALVAESGQVAASVEVAASYSCRLLTHQTLLWHHRLGHPSLLRLRGMHSRLLVSGLPWSLPPLPRSLAPPCLLCVKGRQCAAPHSSLFLPILQTVHMDMWGPARITGQGGERYFLLVFDDYTRYTTVFPLQSRADARSVLIRWIRAVRLDLSTWFRQDLPVLQLHSDRGGEFSSHLLKDFCGAEGIRQSFTLPASQEQNGIAERRIGLVMEVAHTSMIHAAAPHFLWSFAVRYAAHQLNLWPRVSVPETSPTVRWTGKVGDVSEFRVWGSLSLVCDLLVGKLSPRTLWCMFPGSPTDALP
ncbi:unnamed protein product [Closterium sp. NIES-53]